MTIVYNPFTDNLDYKGTSGGGGGISTITGDSGSVTGLNVTVFANNSANNAGGSVSFVNSGTTSTLNLTNSSSQSTYLGLSCGNNTSPSATANTALGYSCMPSISTSGSNVVVGFQSLFSLTSSRFGPIAVGGNVVIGASACQFLQNGTENVFIGYSCAQAYNGSESCNIIIGSEISGETGESNVMRLGETASIGTKIAKAFIGGITGVTVTASSVVLVDANGQVSDLGFGTAGQVLTSNGPGVSPSWQ